MDERISTRVPAVRRLLLNGWVLDMAAGELLAADGGVAGLRRQALEVLLILGARPGQVVGKDELMRSVWPDVVVGDNSLSQAVADIRRVIGDPTREIVRTVARRGYMLVPAGGKAPADAAVGADTGAAHEPPPGLTRADIPSIAVLPFDNMSNDADQSYIADGMVDDIIIGLSRVRQLFVIARNSSFTYKGRSIDVRQVGRELGVRYVLLGSVRKAAHRVRISGQLVEAETGHHIWAERFEGDLSDVFDLQDRITGSVVGAIQPSIRAAEVARARRKRPDSLDAYDLYMQALPHVAALERRSNAIGLELLHRALQLDPSYVSALAMAAWSHGQRCVYNWSEDAGADRSRAMELATRAVNEAADDAFALSVLGAAHTLVRDFDRAEALLSRAVANEPSCAWGWNRLGWLHGYLGRSQESIRSFERALRLSPLDPINFNCWVGIGAAHYLEARGGETIRWMEKAITASPGARWIWRQLVPAYVESGRDDDAARGLRQLLEDCPDLTCEGVRDAMLYPEPVMQRLCAGLARAGLPLR